MSDMKPLDTCCPVCWGMPDNGYDDTTRKECVGDGRVANGVHPQRVELAEWASEPLREWPRELHYLEAPAPKIVNHPEFARGRQHAVANQPRDPQPSYKTIKSKAYFDGYYVGEWKRYSLCPMPAKNPDSVSIDLVASMADQLARFGGDRNEAALHYKHGSYIGEQQFRYVARYLPLVPLNDPPPPPDRTYQVGLFSHPSYVEHGPEVP